MKSESLKRTKLFSTLLNQWKFRILWLIEWAVFQLPEEQGDRFRCKACILLKNWYAKTQFESRDRKAVDSLAKNDDIKILPADKVNITIILVTLTQEKISVTLKDGKIHFLNKNPSENMECQVAKLSQQTFSEKLRTKFISHHSKIPHICHGLPKIQKQWCCLVPYISPCHSFFRELSTNWVLRLRPERFNTFGKQNCYIDEKFQIHWQRL